METDSKFIYRIIDLLLEDKVQMTNKVLQNHYLSILKGILQNPDLDQVEIKKYGPKLFELFKNLVKNCEQNSSQFDLFLPIITLYLKHLSFNLSVPRESFSHRSVKEMYGSLGKEVNTLSDLKLKVKTEQGISSFMNEYIFPWIEETLKLNGNKKFCIESVLSLLHEIKETLFNSIRDYPD
jgi:hypothetical protein